MGVNLDEEAARLIQFQQSYQAAAKLLQTSQTLFEALIRNDRITVDDLWARARRQFEANRTGPARLTLAALPASQASSA